jgi:hypothetical protein
MQSDRSAAGDIGARFARDANLRGSPPLAENAITQRFLARWAEKPPTRLRDLAAELKLPFTFGNRFLTRPAFLEAEQRRALEADVGALLDLLFTLPKRLFDGDLKAMAGAVGLAPAQAEAIVRTAADQQVRLARADLFDDGNTYKLLEFNVSSAIGGWDSPVLNRWLLRDPDLASFVEDEGLEFADTLAALAGVIREACAGFDCPSRPVVALVDWPPSYPTYGPVLDFMARSLQPLGIAAIGCHAGQLAVRDGHLFIEGRHIDVVYRFIQLGDLLEGPGALAVVEPIIAAAERGTVRLVTGFAAGLFASKGCLALLYEDDHRSVFSAAENDLIDRVLPWTRTLRAGETFVGGQRTDLVGYVLANRSELVLKPSLLHSGLGVVLGWKTDQRTWTEAVRAGLRSRFVVQRRVRPAAERFPADDTATGSRELVLNWGVFAVGRGYSGAFVRALPDPDPGIINAATGAATGCTFHAVEPPRGRSGRRLG